MGQPTNWPPASPEARQSLPAGELTLDMSRSGLIGRYARLTERSNIPGLIGCSFHRQQVDEQALSPSGPTDLLRWSEAINVRYHAQPVKIEVSLRKSVDLVLRITDNGSGLMESALSEAMASVSPI